MPYPANDVASDGELRSLPLAFVDPSPYQPRRRFQEDSIAELAASIREQGVIQPIVVREVGERYELIAGERRLRAARKAGLSTIPAVVRRYSDQEALEAALVENLQREDISIVEVAQAYQRLADDFHYTQGEIALRTGKSRAAVNNTLRLLHLPDAILVLLDEGELTEGHARALLSLPYPSLQVEVAEWIVRNAVPVRVAEKRIRRLNGGSVERRPIQKGSVSRDSYISALEERLRTSFGTKVEVIYKGGKGAVQIEFYSDDDLERILELLDH